MKNIFTLCSIVLMLALANFTNAQWQQTNGPRGGLASCYASDDDEIYAGTNYGGLFRSTNEGASWTACNNGLTALNITALSTDNETVYIGNGTNGLYRSTDDGQSWQTFPSFWSSYQLSCIATQGENMYVGTWGSGFMVSNDGGSTWANAMDGIAPSIVGYMAPYVQIVDDLVYCIVNGQLYISNDDAASWNLLEDGFPENTSIYQIQAVGNSLVTTTSAGLFTSDNDGQSWADVTANLPIPMSFPMTSAENYLYISGNYGEGIFYSNDNGLTWTVVNESWQNAVASIYAVGVGKLLVQTSFTSADNLSDDQDALYYTENNGNTWENVTNEITNTICLSMVVLGNELFTGTNATGIFSTSDQGETWSHLGVNNAEIRTMHAVGNTLLAAGPFVGIKRSIDNGETWSYASQGLYNISTRGFTHIDENIFAANIDGVYVSADDGQNWSPQNNGLTTLNILSLHAIEDTLFAGTQNGVFISTNYANSWESISNGLPPYSTVTSIKNIGNTIVIVVSNSGIYTSQDNGANWTNVNSLTSFSTLEVSGNMLLAGTRADYGVTQVGVMMSNDLGATWQDVNQGLTNNMVFDLQVAGDYIYACTLGSGVFKRPLADFISENISEEMTQDISIYPNPTSDNITIKILSKLIGSDAIITNELGQQVQRIGNVTSTNFQIDCSSLAAGFYVVKIGEHKVKLVVE